MKKQYRLIYLKNGMLYGSVKTVPTDKDEPLIERAVLEGFKEPSFNPKTGEADKLTEEAQDNLLSEEN
jgi:hypothetical protein